MTGNNFCAVDGCDSRLKGELSFFRCPKEKERCRIWKNALGFTGSHKYADMTPEKSYGRIRICALHFDENSFANSSRNRIHSYSVPSLRLPTDLAGKVYDANQAIKKEPNIETNEAFLQTDSVEFKDFSQVLHNANQGIKKESNIEINETFLQTDSVEFKDFSQVLHNANQGIKKESNIEINETFLQTDSVEFKDFSQGLNDANQGIKKEPNFEINEAFLETDSVEFKDFSQVLHDANQGIKKEPNIETNEAFLQTDSFAFKYFSQVSHNANQVIKKESNIETNDAFAQTDSADFKEPCQFLDKGAQTSKMLSERIPRVLELKETIKTLQKTIKTTRRLDKEVKMEDVEKFLERNFTGETCKLLKAQLSLLNRKPKGSRYTDEFKQFALSVYSIWPKAYKKFSTLFRLPSKSTLQRFTRRWPINPGFNEFIFGVIKCRASLLKDKDCILCLEEISLKSHLYYDISKDKIIGFQTISSTNIPKIAGTALIIMARGIASSWKQPIGYFFCERTSNAENLKDIIFESVRNLHNVGLNVLGVVSDHGSNFNKLVKNTLKLTEDDPTFFVDDKKLVYLFDIPHLTKSTRNNLFSYTFVLMNDGETRKKFIEMMYNSDKTRQYKLAPQLTKQHIYPDNFQKKKVNLATQVFSHSVAVAMHTYIEFNVLPKEASTTANFILKINNLFELLNSSNLEHSQAFMATEKQLSLLKEMDDIFQNLKVLNCNRKDVTNKVKFIFGWRMTMKSIILLWGTLQAKGYKYLFTQNLNQNSIKNHFGQRKSYGNTKNPTPIQFCRSFKKLFASQYFDRADGTNCMDDVSEILMNLTPEFTKTSQNIVSVNTPTYAPLKVFTNDYLSLRSPDGNALIYVTEYLLKKCLLQHSCEVCINFYSKTNENLSNEETFFKLKAYHQDTEKHFGCLIIPYRDVVDYILQLESIFLNKFNELAGEQAVGKHLKNEFIKTVYIHPCGNFPLDYFITLYTRVRIYFTLKLINIDVKTRKFNKGAIELSILKTL